MAKSKVSAVPDTRTLHAFLEELRETLGEAERGLNKVLSLDPRTETYWDELARLHPVLTTMESSAQTIQAEVENLVDQLPED
jgi:hypothetical protein